MRKVLKGARSWMRWTLILAGIVTAAYLLWLPYVPALKHENPQRTALMDLRARQAARKGKKYVPRMTWRSLEQISPSLIRAVILAEDDTFYEHNGFDPAQIKIALKMNWEKKRYAYGGSTITQQLARTLYLSPRKRLLRKLKEALITLWLEESLAKRRILEIYLNVVEWGDGIFGIEQAARHYYGKSAAELTPEESVALAAVLPSPRKWSPLRVTPFQQRRRANLLSRLRPEPGLRMPASAAVPGPETPPREEGEEEEGEEGEPAISETEPPTGADPPGTAPPGPRGAIPAPGKSW